MNYGLIRRAGAAIVVSVGLLVPSLASAAEGGVALDHFPTEKLTNLPSLQNGAKLFINYCLGCHSANSMRYNRLQDIGLTEQQIKENLLFTGEKVGDPMKIAMNPADAKTWLGAAPPDLSVIARARSSGAGSGSDWLYTFLRSFYRDASRPTGWNNTVFPNVGMPHVLWPLEGQRGVVIRETKSVGGGDGHGGQMETLVKRYDLSGGVTEEKADADGSHGAHAGTTFELLAPVGGSLNRLEYDNEVGDLVAYLTYMADPTARTRGRLGIWVLIFLGILFVATWMLNKAFWRDIK